MSLNDTNSTCQRHLYWNYQTTNSCFLTSSWQIKNDSVFAGTCIAVVFLAMTFELLRRLSRELDRLLVRRWETTLPAPPLLPQIPNPVVRHAESEYTAVDSGNGLHSHFLHEREVMEEQCPHQVAAFTQGHPPHQVHTHPQTIGLENVPEGREYVDRSTHMKSQYADAGTKMTPVASERPSIIPPIVRRKKKKRYADAATVMTPPTKDAGTYMTPSVGCSRSGYDSEYTGTGTGTTSCCYDQNGHLVPGHEHRHGRERLSTISGSGSYGYSSDYYTDSRYSNSRDTKVSKGRRFFDAATWMTPPTRDAGTFMTPSSRGDDSLDSRNFKSRRTVSTDRYSRQGKHSKVGRSDSAASAPSRRPDHDRHSFKKGLGGQRGLHRRATTSTTCQSHHFHDGTNHGTNHVHDIPDRQTGFSRHHRRTHSAPTPTTFHNGKPTHRVMTPSSTIREVDLPPTTFTPPHQSGSQNVDDLPHHPHPTKASKRSSKPVKTQTHPPLRNVPNSHAVQNRNANPYRANYTSNPLQDSADRKHLTPHTYFRPGPFQQLLRAGVYCILVSLGIVLVLLVLSFNGYVILSVCLGVLLGNLLFGWDTGAVFGSGYRESHGGYGALEV